MDMSSRGQPGNASELPPRRILAVATTGGFTHAAPILEICRLLAAQGHTVDFATLGGQESWVDDCPFISTLHVFGTCPTAEQTEAHYCRMLRWDPSQGLGPIMESKYLWDSFWTVEHENLRRIVTDPSTRPNLILADFFAEAAAKDMMVEFGLPVAVMWPQMPFLMAPVPYIPGQPGFQVDMTLTSEHASIWSRLRNELVVVRALPSITSWMLWVKRMRRAAGVTYKTPAGPKPSHLVLVNSFFGLEVPKDLPPLIQAVGPILADEYPPLTTDFSTFLEKHDRTLYVALGTHIVLPEEDIHKILRGLSIALDAGHINGVIWSIGKTPGKSFDWISGPVPDGTGEPGSAGIVRQKDQFYFPAFAPQRAILQHPNCRLFLTHGGGSSANEALYHGTPVLTLGFFFDQLCNSARLKAAGVGLQLDKTSFTAEEVSDKVGKIVSDGDDSGGPIHRNVERMRRIARIASRRKYLAVDLIEEVMYDAELRVDEGGRELQARHLETADVRMSTWRARNWDLFFLGIGCAAMVPLSVVAARHVGPGRSQHLWAAVVSSVRSVLR